MPISSVKRLDRETKAVAENTMESIQWPKGWLALFELMTSAAPIQAEMTERIVENKTC